jgi:hypothetical protein
VGDEIQQKMKADKWQQCHERASDLYIRSDELAESEQLELMPSIEDLRHKYAEILKNDSEIFA